MAKQMKSESRRQSRRRILAAVTACILAVMMLLPMLITALTPARAATESELRDLIASLENEVKQAQQSQQQLQSQLNAVKGQTQQALQEKALRDQELAYIDQQISATEAQIAYYDELIAQEEIDLEAAILKEEEQYELFCRRVRAMEEQGTISYWSILFSAESFSDMLDLFTIVNDTIAYDNAVIEQLKEDRQAVEDTLESLNAAQDEQDAKKAELDEQYAAQEVKVAEAMALVTKYQTDMATYQQAIDDEEAAAAAIEKQIQAVQDELDELIRQQQIATGDGYVWPVRGWYTLTSAYGYRTHPITGQLNKLHNGLDIAAAKNTEVHAVRGGIVSISGWDNSYGNYIVVQHGNGDSSLYAHLNSRAVKAGETVTQDQVIGYVGTTGSSNGYHLHLEIRVNGSRVDPHDIYVGSVPFVYASSYNKNAVKP